MPDVVGKTPPLIEKSDRWLFRTSLPRDQVTDDLVLSRVRHANLLPGDVVIVQCVTHIGDRVLAETEYRVTKCEVSRETRDLDGYHIRQEDARSYAIVQVRDWLNFEEDAKKAKVVWNPGKKIHEVKVGSQTVHQTTDKDEAQRIAAGELPVPA